MKLKNFLFFIIYISLFCDSFQISEYENIILEKLPITNNNSFKIIINYLNGKYYTPMSPRDAINIKIESKNEDLNNYFFKYYYVKENKKNIFTDDYKYNNDSNIIMITPEAKYIIAEMKHKIKNNKIYLKSEVISYYNNYSQNLSINNYNELFNLNQDKIFNIIIFFSSFCLASTISVILICIDLKEDKKIIKTYNLTTKERARQEYQVLRKTYINRNIFSFALFLMKFTYPIFNIFSFYNYDHPRYIRFFIILIKILLNLLISFLFYKFKDFHNYSFINHLIPFFYSLIASLLICIFCQLITKLFLGYDKIRKDIWKPKFECLRKYIFYSVKKDILFDTKWHFIRNRMISYTRICGNRILRRKPEDKYKIYSDNKKKYNKTLINEKEISNDIDTKKQEDIEGEEFYKKYIYANSCVIQNKNNNNNLIGNNMRRKKTFFAKTNGKNFNSFLYIVKGVQSFSISKLGQNNLKLKTVQKLEDIRNRYILNANDSKFDETLEVNYFVKTYDNLEIESLENYTYISTDSVNNQQGNPSSESNKIFMNLIVTFILLLLLALVDYSLILVYGIIDKKYIDHFFKIVFAQIIINNFFLNYIYSLFISYYIFNKYGYEKKKCFHKIIFKLFVEKYIKYIYRLRLLINKYRRELQYMDR